LIATVIAAAARLVAGSTMRSLSGVPDTRQRIYIANHSSHLDFIVLWASLPPEVRALTRPVAAADYWAGGIRAYLARDIFNAVLIKRAAGVDGRHAVLDLVEDAVAVMVAALGDDHSLILFPEGTRGEGEVSRFRSGLYHLCAARPDVEVMPVYMENLNRILPKGAVIPVPLLSRIMFGSPIRLEPEESKPVFLARARQAVVDLAA
jgi:1-acyl-sn-glycerol-3-phosphate acyltransferase